MNGLVSGKVFFYFWNLFIIIWFFSLVTESEDQNVNPQMPEDSRDLSHGLEKDVAEGSWIWLNEVFAYSHSINDKS